MRRDPKVDTNQVELVGHFRRLGFSVLSLAGVGVGCPDLLIARGGLTCLVEVKFEKGKLRPMQSAFIADWHGRIEVARTLDDVIRIANTWYAQPGRIMFPARDYGSEPF